MDLRNIVLPVLLIATLTTSAIGQTRLTYADTTGTICDWQTNMPWVGPFLVYGYGERFDLPINSGTIDSVDFVIDSMGSDSITLELMEDTILDKANVYEHVPNLANNPYAKITIYKQSITPGSRTHVSLSRTVVPDSFFVIVFNDSNTVTEYRSYRVPPENPLLGRSVFLSVDTEYGSGDFTAILDQSFATNVGDTSLYAEMDIGVTYEGTDGVQMHLAPSSFAAFPNPASVGNPIRFRGTGSIATALVLDEAGRLVKSYQGSTSAPLTQIPTQGLSAGVYNAVLYDVNGTESSVRIVVE